jgi:hypothetical protein
VTIKTTTLVESDVEHPLLFGKTSTQSTRVEITTEGGGIETIQETALAAAATYRTAIVDDVVDTDVVDDPEPTEAEVSPNDADISSGIAVLGSGREWEAGLPPFDRVVELLGEIDLGASPKKIARAINTAGIYFIQRKAS